MKSQILGKFISALICGLAFGLFVYHNEMARHDMGRDAFLAAQGARFDRLYAHPHSAVSFIIIAIILLGFCLSIYELIAFCISRILKPMDATEGSSGTPGSPN